MCYCTTSKGDGAMDETTRAAFERLLPQARSDTGQSRRVADFILAWWNADELGGFDIADVLPSTWRSVTTWRGSSPGSPADRTPNTRIPIARRSRRSSVSGGRRSGLGSSEAV
ncbi:DUF7673 family protein [Mesorhizobium mediterraneum]|uniref:DUF7673 family protein n=1 Tax=Mesorhizobium mediterraneum TaxID=43617 RepID=UPI003D7E5E2E